MTPDKTTYLPWREIDGRAVIIHPALGQVHELDEVATFLWKAADGKATLDEIAERLTRAFEVEVDEARADAEAFYRELESQGLVRWAS